LAKYLLQLRHNFLPIILASKMSNIEDSFLEKLSHKYKWSSWSIGDWQLTFGGWEIDPGSFEKAEYAWFHEILAKGFETRNFLKSIGVNLIVNESVDKIFKNLTWVIHDDSRYQQLIQQLGMIPTFDQVEKFQGKIDFQPKVKTDPEKLIVLLNEYTGSTLFVFNREGAERAKESEKELYKKMQELQQERQRQLHQKKHRELEKRFYNPDLVKGA
ncbi:MAG: hypothetical protein KDD40_10590, partial [Bdellovibrionales bacterium]|nr:hypothetical protein [Bdellovibrionales bacterium]